jgi:hypothetical protein
LDRLFLLDLFLGFFFRFVLELLLLESEFLEFLHFLSFQSLPLFILLSCNLDKILFQLLLVLISILLYFASLYLQG